VSLLSSSLWRGKGLVHIPEGQNAAYFEKLIMTNSGEGGGGGG